MDFSGKYIQMAISVDTATATPEGDYFVHIEPQLSPSQDWQSWEYNNNYFTFSSKKFPGKVLDAKRYSTDQRLVVSDKIEGSDSQKFYYVAETNELYSISEIKAISI